MTIDDKLNILERVLEDGYTYDDLMDGDEFEIIQCEIISNDLCEFEDFSDGEAKKLVDLILIVLSDECGLISNKK